jgi:hypothetical protein
MAANKKEVFGPVALTATLTTNIIAPAAAGAGAVGYTATADIILISQIRLVNKTAAAHNVTLYKGATGANVAGTELCFQKNVPANDFVDMYFAPFRLEGTNGFLVGGADAVTSITLIAMGEIGAV